MTRKENETSDPRKTTGNGVSEDGQRMRQTEKQRLRQIVKVWDRGWEIEGGNERGRLRAIRTQQ